MKNFHSLEVWKYLGKKKYHVFVGEFFCEFGNSCVTLLSIELLCAVLYNHSFIRFLCFEMLPDLSYFLLNKCKSLGE